MATIEISIAAHYVPERAPFLAEVLEAISGWPQQSVHVTIVTNDLALAKEPALESPLLSLLARGYTTQFDETHGLEHPFHLTWWHKDRLRAWHRAGGDQHDLFIYIEDDIVLDATNIAYFQRSAGPLAVEGLIPGFFRYENAASGELVSVDFRSPQLVRDRDLRQLGKDTFVVPNSPYWAGFIFDRSLCEEYLSSPWAEIETAASQPEASGHTCRVHSAWGLTYANVADGLSSRCALPLDENLSPLPECRVRHAAGNYSVSRSHGFGSIPVDKVFVRDSAKARATKASVRVKQFARRVVGKAQRSFVGKSETREKLQ